MRTIYIVNATQVVTSESHPEGLYTVMDGFPKRFDSRNYPAADGNPNGNAERALEVAKAAYYDQLSKNYNANNRAMTTVTLERADGRQYMRECIGAFPDLTPKQEELTEEPAE